MDCVGNSVYKKEDLKRVFNVEKGSVYNQSLIEDRLNGSAGAQDAVSNLYQDNGYLFSRLTPVEAKIDNDSIDLEVRIYEGEQAYLNNVIMQEIQGPMNILPVVNYIHYPGTFSAKPRS